MSSLTKAIVLLRTRVRARHQGDGEQLRQLNEDINHCQPFVGQVQQALKLNTEGMTLSKVTPGWVKSKMRSSEVTS